MALAGSILEGLSWPRFFTEDEMNGAYAGSTEGRTGLPRFAGDPAKFADWKFHFQTRLQKEKSLSEEEKAKCGPLGLRLLDGLSGHALQVAQLRADGALYLVEQLQTQLRPRGTSPLKMWRRNLWRSTLAFTSALERPCPFASRSRIAAVVLDHLYGNFARVSRDLQRESTGYAFYTEEDEDWSEETWSYDENYEDTVSHIGYAVDYMDEPASSPDLFETGTFSEEYLAYLVDQGLELESVTTKATRNGSSTTSMP